MIPKNTDLRHVQTGVVLTKADRAESERLQIEKRLEERRALAREINAQHGISGPRVNIGCAYLPPSIALQFTHIRGW